MMFGFMVALVLMGVGRSFGEVSSTFSCSFEEMGHVMFWDSILLLLGFLVFEFEIVFIILSMLNVTLLVLIMIFLVMFLEVLQNGFGY